MDELVFGEFTVGTRTYTLTEEDYDKVPEDTPGEFIISAAKYIAIARQAQPCQDNKFRESDFFYDKDDPVPRFIGHILIVDANNLAHRCRYTYNLSHNGKDVSVVYGFLNVLASVIRSYTKVAAVICCWDEGIPKHRREAIPQYKRNRDHSDDEDYEDFLIQMKELRDEVLPSFGVTSVSKKGCEADDLIYKATKLLHGDYLKIVVSSDKDMLQCVSTDTSLLFPIKKSTITFYNFEENVGVRPQAYMIYKCLVGDRSDNIPGCKGIGEVTAIKLIDTYGASASNLMNVATGQNPVAEPMTPKMSEKIRKFGLEGFKNVLNCIRLDRDLCGAGARLLDEFEYWEPYNTKEVKKFMLKYAFVSFMEPAFYNLFKQLSSPKSFLIPDLGSRVRIPVIAPLREPLSVSEKE